MKKPAPQKQNVVPVMYVGERCGRTAICQVFKDANGGEHWFQKIRMVFVGEWYGMIDETMARRPKQIPGRTMTEDEHLEADAEKAVVTAFRNDRRAAAKANKPNARIAQAVELLRPFYWALNYPERRYFVEYLANEMSKPKRKK